MITGLTQYECDELIAPKLDCLQYHTAPSGDLDSKIKKNTLPWEGFIKKVGKFPYLGNWVCLKNVPKGRVQKKKKINGLVH